MLNRLFPSVVGLAAVLLSMGAVSWGEEEPAELTQARALYERDVEFANRPIRDRYVSKLDALKRALGARGDARAALAVQDEIDRVKGSSPQATGKGRFEGRWTVRYDNGAVRKLSIDANDMVTMLEENDKPTAKLRGKIQAKGNDSLLDLGDAKIERWNFSNGTLIIEHFFPKSTYPNGPISARGVGTRTAPK